MKRLCLIAGLVMYLIVPSSFAEAQSSEDISVGKEILREIVQLKIQIAKLEEGQRALDKRMDDMNNRMDDMNKRMDDMNNRMGDMNNRIDGIQGWMQVILAGMIGFVGFILWDRRTAVLPVMKRTIEIEKELATEKEIVGKLVTLMREYANKEPQFAEMLRTAGV